MIRPARWLPLSLALHAATLAGGVWVARELAERPLFVDLTLNEPDERAAGAGSGGAPAGVPWTTRGASSSPRPAPPMARTPARGTASAAASSSAAATPSAPVTPSPAPVTPSPAPATPTDVAPSSPAAPSAATSPPIASPPPVDSPRVVESSRSAAPAAAAEIVVNVEPSATRGSDVGPAAASAGSAPDGAGSVGTEGGGDKRGAEGGSAAAGLRGPGSAGDGELALAVPGGGGAEMYGPYLAMLRRRLQQELEYPPAARRRGLSGIVDLEIALESTGRVSEVSLVRSSSHAILDDAALTAARKLSRVPFPPDVKPRALRVRLPVVFELR